MSGATVPAPRAGDNAQKLIGSRARPQGASGRDADPLDTSLGGSESASAYPAHLDRDELLAGVIDTSPNAFVVLNTDGEVEWWNRAAERLFGWTAAEALGRKLTELVVPEHLRAAHSAGVRRRARGDAPRLGDEPVMQEAVCRDGRRLWVELSFGEVAWHDGRKFHAFIHDVTEREASRLALLHSEERFRSIFANAPIGKVLTSLREADFGQLLAANPAVQAMLGYSEDELRSLTFSAITHPDDAAQDVEMVSRLVRGEVDKIDYEKRYVRADGTVVWVALSATAVREADGTAIHSIAQLIDITERRAQAEQLEQLNQELQVTNVELSAVNAELDNFAATVAHDLKNQLAAVAGFAELLADVSDNPAQQKQVEDAIVRGTRDMNRLVDDLLDYSRAASADVRLADVDLEQLVTDVGATFTERPTRPLHVVLSHDPLPELKVEPVLFRQVLINVVGNAIKYVAAGVEPHVHISAHAETSPPGWTLSFADNGIGIPDAARERVFTMFHRESPQGYPGTGVGLATCRRVVERHGGRIWIEPGHPSGTIVKIWLPVLDPDQPPSLPGG